jgi:NitT/TauT family transport system permease protein
VSSRWKKILAPFAVAAVLVAIWHLLTYGAANEPAISKTRFPTPWEVVLGFKQLLTTRPGEKAPQLVSSTVASVFRVMAGFNLAMLLGIPLGLLMGWYAGTYRALNPLVQLLRPISPIAWIPIAILMFRNDEPRSIFLIFVSTIFPITTAAAAAVQNIPQVYIRSAANFGCDGWNLFKKVVLPASLPQILTGLRLALGVGWIVIVAAEMIAVRSGLGRLIQDARDATGRLDLIVATMITIGAIGIGLDALVRRLESVDQIKWGYAKRG